VACARLFELAVTAVAGWSAGRDPVLYNSAVDFRAPGSDTVYIAQPAAALFLGFTLLLLYPGSKDRSSGRLVMLWTLLFAFRNAFVAFAVASVDPESPVARALAEWDVPEGVDLVVAIVGALGLVLVAIGAAAAFLSFSRHRSEVATAKERLRFAASIALLPGLAGPLLAVPMFLPDAGTGFVSTLPLAGAFVVITTLAASFTKSFAPPQVIEERGVSIGLVIAFAVVVLVTRFGLGPGVPIPPWDSSLQLTWRP
jgi:hypothetical protein